MKIITDMSSTNIGSTFPLASVDVISMVESFRLGSGRLCVIVVILGYIVDYYYAFGVGKWSGSCSFVRLFCRLQHHVCKHLLHVQT